MKLRMTLVSMSLLVAVLGLGLFGASASAAPRQKQAPGTGSTTNPHPVRIMGRVDSVSSSGLVLHTQRGNLTVNVNNTTWILVQSNGRCAEGALTDIQTGRPAEVAGMTTATANTINARVIVQGRCMGPVAGKPAVKDLLTHLATGTVKSVNGSTITLTAVNGNREITVNTNVNTVVLANGFQSLSTIKVGDKVDVIGKPELAQGNPPPAAPKNGTRTLDAWAIHVQSAGTQVMLGHVDSVNGNTVTIRTLKNRDGVTVTLDAKTGYMALTVTNGTAKLTTAAAADVKAGTNVLVEGTSSSDGKTTTAKAVIILPAKK